MDLLITGIKFGIRHGIKYIFNDIVATNVNGNVNANVNRSGKPLLIMIGTTLGVGFSTAAITKYMVKTPLKVCEILNEIVCSSVHYY